MEKKEKTAVIAVAILLLLCAVVYSVYAVKKANVGGRQGDRLQGAGMPSQPSDKVPAEVAASCQGKSEGDVCEATSPQNSDKQSGTCKKMGNNAQLICLPVNMPARPTGGGNRPVPTQDEAR